MNREDILNSEGSVSTIKITEKHDEIWLETLVFFLSNEVNSLSLIYPLRIIIRLKVSRII